MLFNLSNPDTAMLSQIRDLVGSALVSPDKISPSNPNIQVFTLIDVDDEIIAIINKQSDVINCKIEIRKQGLLIWLGVSEELAVLAFPYWLISLFKGADYLQLYCQSWRLKLLIQDKNESQKFQQNFLQRRAIIQSQYDIY
ncbi:MAG: hypothetical protein CMB82_08465 [Flammeovirgaceae bacterium]|nr:hypothetical protein [Flammeovirgaceae bacterium]|tara:strand:- start:57 stop:479 length:423 start_codon:yes stop_codon:yes gene_type:complete